MNTATIPSWVAECSKAHNRGFLVCIEASTVAVGTVIAYWVCLISHIVQWKGRGRTKTKSKFDFRDIQVDYGCAQVDSSFSWRFPVALQIFFAIFILIGEHPLHCAHDPES